MSKDILSSIVFHIYLYFIQGFIGFDQVAGFLMLLEFNYFHYSNRRVSRIKTFDKVFNGCIFQYVSFFTDEFESMGELPDYDESFFENLKKLDFEDERARIFEDFLCCGYLSSIATEQNLGFHFYNHIKVSTWYIMACNALKRGSLKINCEDVVIGYRLTLRFITEDMRPYIKICLL